MGLRKCGVKLKIQKQYTKKNNLIQIVFLCVFFNYLVHFLLLKNQDRIPEEQLNEIMNSIENLFSDNTVDWIDAEFDEPKLNKLFF